MAWGQYTFADYERETLEVAISTKVRKLKSLEKQIQNAFKILSSNIVSKDRYDLSHEDLNRFPPVPEWCIENLQEKDPRIPEASGIYMFDDTDRWAYVGQSINLRGRVSPKHERFRHGFRVRWLLVESRDDLVHHECFYIALLGPYLNGQPPRRTHCITAP